MADEVADLARRGEGVGLVAGPNDIDYALAAKRVVVMTIGGESVSEPVGVGAGPIAGELIGIDAVLGVLDAAG